MFSVFDAHCDTAGILLDEKQELFKNSHHLDIKRINDLNTTYVQVFAAFASGSSPFKRADSIINCYHSQTGKNSDIAHCTTYAEMQRAIENKKIASFLSVEGGDALEGNEENLEYFHSRGVRIFTLSWNFKNEICSGNADEKDFGISPFGEKVVKKIENLGIIADASHISEKSFWDLCCLAKNPFIASHSNAKAICYHKRNLTDEQIKAVIEKNGCIGINFYPPFLTNKSSCGIKDIINHTEHILSLGGEKNVGFGSDFDGVDFLPKGINGVESYFNLAEEFLKLGYSKALLQDIFFNNFARVIKTVLK